MRRTIAGLLAFIALTATFLVLPVYAAPGPDAEPIAPSIDQVALGSVEDPAEAAVVTEDGELVDPTDEAEPTNEAQPTNEAEPTDEAEVPSSGQELADVPALAVSEEDTAEFSSVGVTWTHDESVAGVVVQLRVADEEGSWGEWTTLQQDDVELTGGAPDDAELRDGTAPYFTGTAHGVQVIVQAADGQAPQDVRAELIDPGTSDADTALGAAQVRDQAHAASTMPAIYSRAQWGADESIRSWDPEFASTVKAATVHHTADTNNYSADQVPAMLRSIYAYHSLSRGWGDIGYNVLVDKYGRAWEGRYSGSRGLGSPIIGAHAGGFNTSTFGVSMLGNYDEAPTTAPMVSAVAAVIAWKLALYGVDPAGTTQLTSSGGGTSKYAAGTVVTLPTVFGHRDVGSTSCPGQYGYAQLGSIRSQAHLLWQTARDPSGSLDAAAGGEQQISVAGWAYDPDQPTTPLTVHVYVDGAPQVALTADKRRDDLAAAVPGVGSSHGYSTTLAATRGSHVVCTYAINVGSGTMNPQLGCGTVNVTGPVPDPRGTLDAASLLGRTVYFSGWTFDDDAPRTSIPVHVYVDGVGARAITADETRDDIAAAFPGTGSAHGYSGAVAVGAGTHTVCFFAINTGPGAHTVLGCRTVTSVAAPDDPIGSFDGATVNGRTVSIAGWAIDPSAPSSAASVHVYVDGAGTAALTTDQQRMDLAVLFPTTGSRHGWSSSLTLRAGDHSICLYGINVGAGGNVALGCRTVTVSAAAYDPIGSLDGAQVSGRAVRVDGWVIDPDDPSAPSVVHVYIDGRPVVGVLGDGNRPDVAGVVDGAGPAHGYSATVQVAAGTHTVCAFAINVGAGTANPLLGCRQVVVAAAAWNPFGIVDAATRSGGQISVAGWVVDPDAPAAQTWVHVYVDGRSTVALSTGQPRPDISAAVPGAGPAQGWAGSVTVSAGSHQVCLYAINIGDGSSNPLLGCRTVAG